MVFFDVGLSSDIGVAQPDKTLRNVPAGVAVLFVSSIILNIRVADAEHNQSTLRGTLRHIDALGAVSFIGAMVCLLLALQWAGQTIAWSSTKIVGLFIGFGVLIVGFWVLQIRRGENATLPLRILRKRSVWTGAMFLFFLSMTSFVVRIRDGGGMPRGGS